MQVVNTALRILEAVAAQQPVGVSELARSLDLPKTTVHRGLKALEKAGWIGVGNAEPTRWVLRLLRRDHRQALRRHHPARHHGLRIDVPRAAGSEAKC